MISDAIVKLAVAAANANGIEPAAMLAIVEVETAGSPLEADGRTPNFLYERHVAYREAGARSKTLLAAFVRAGLAIPKWSRATQYRDQRTSAQRLALMRQAVAVDEEVARRSASWGLGQTMGNECRALGFPSAVALVNYQIDGGIPAQLECMVREIKSKHLIGPLNAHAWAHVARSYNGAGYAANRYDTRLAAAYAKWTRALPRVSARETPPPEQSLSRDEVAALQRRLRAKGFPQVGKPDGIYGVSTVGAVSAFQAHEGLHVTGHLDAPTRQALEEAAPREPAEVRADTTAADLAGKSRIVDSAQSTGLMGKIKAAFGTTLLGGGAAKQAGLLDLDTASAALDKVDQAKSVWEKARDIFGDWLAILFGHPAVMVFGVLFLIAGIAVIHHSRKVVEARVEDERTGVHAGHADGEPDVDAGEAAEEA
jgi:hypothetical protein